MRQTYYVCLYLGPEVNRQGWPALPTDGVVFGRLRDAREWVRDEGKDFGSVYRIVKVRVERVCDKNTRGER